MTQARNPHDKTQAVTAHIPGSLCGFALRRAESMRMTLSEYISSLIASDKDQAWALKESLNQVFQTDEQERDA